MLIGLSVESVSSVASVERVERFERFERIELRTLGTLSMLSTDSIYVYIYEYIALCSSRWRYVINMIGVKFGRAALIPVKLRSLVARVRITYAILYYDYDYVNISYMNCTKFLTPGINICIVYLYPLMCYCNSFMVHFRSC